MRKTARQHLKADKQIKKVLLDKNWGGMKAGDMMFVATPKIVDDFIQSIPAGQTMTIAELRQALAENNGCAGTCPLSTSIFVRMSAQAALEDMAEGKTNAQITPFWRVISSLDKISKKLDIDPAWIDQQRSLEGEQ